MQSNGGLMSSAQARADPVHTLLSGPAGGVVGAVAVRGAAGRRDVITMDMGGTSLDISLVQGGARRPRGRGPGRGFPVKVPQVDTHTIGAGGGSIARVRPRDAQGRARQRRCGPGPRLLRPRRHRAH